MVLCFSKYSEQGRLFFFSTLLWDAELVLKLIYLCITFWWYVTLFKLSTLSDPCLDIVVKRCTFRVGLSGVFNNLCSNVVELVTMVIRNVVNLWVQVLRIVSVGTGEKSSAYSIFGASTNHINLTLTLFHHLLMVSSHSEPMQNRPTIARRYLGENIFFWGALRLAQVIGSFIYYLNMNHIDA